MWEDILIFFLSSLHSCRPKMIVEVLQRDDFSWRLPISGMKLPGWILGISSDSADMVETADGLSSKVPSYSSTEPGKVLTEIICFLILYYDLLIKP